MGPLSRSPWRTRAPVRLAVAFLVMVVMLSILFLMPLPATKASADVDDPSREMQGIVDVNAGNFESIVGHDRFVLLEFYAGWCGHCRNFAPVYEKLGKYVLTQPELSERLVIGKVNTPVESQLQRQYNIDSYPTLKLMLPHSRDGIDYTSARDIKLILSFVKSHMLDSTKRAE